MSLLYKVNFVLKKLFPTSLYSKIRLFLLKVYRYKLHSFTEDEIRQVFADLGVKKGAVVFIHSSMNQIKTDFPFYNLTNILLEMIGDEGTLMFPCWQEIKSFNEYVNQGSVFDVKRTPTYLGILPELARRRKDAKRSLSPFNSVVAIGKNAEHFVNEHHLDSLSLGVKSPFYKLSQANGLILGVGVTSRYLTFVHCIEDTYNGQFPMQTRYNTPIPMKVKTMENEIITVDVKVPHPNISGRNIPSFLRKYIDPKIAADLTIKRTNFFFAYPKELMSEMTKLAQKNITIYNN